MLVDNSLSGPIGATPSDAGLVVTSRAGTVTVDAASRAEYSATRLVHGLTTLEVGTGYARTTTPTLEVALPASGSWAARWYVWMPSLQAAGLGIDEVRWHCTFPDTGLGLVVHETASGNVGKRLQPADLDASAIVWDSETGSATSFGQWWRIELVFDGTDLVCSTYAGHATTGARVHTWLGRDVGRTLRVGGYRYRRGAFLPYGNGSFSQEVQDYQNDLIDLGYPAPDFGADGFYGDEMAGQLDGFAAGHGMGDLVGTFGAGGGAGAEVLAAIDLAWQEDQAVATPPPLYLSNLAVDTAPIGPASTPGTGATLSASGSVGSTGAKHTTTTATVSGQGVLSSTASKHTSTTATLSATGSVSAEVSARHIPTFPPALTTELWIDGAWVDITSDVRTSEDLNIRRGRADEAARADPSSLSLLLNNRHGRYSPRNPMSPYYGQIGRNTRIRVRAGSLPDPGVTLLADTFDREVTDGWGTPDTGPAWVTVLGTEDQFSTSDGAGHLIAPAHTLYVGAGTSEDLPADFDATWEVSVDARPEGALPGALYLSANLRRDTLDTEYTALRLGVSIRTFSGAVDGRCRVGADIGSWDGVDELQLTPVSANAEGVTYAPGEWLRVRCVLIGPQVRMKVWPVGQPEPPVWIAQAYVGLVGAGRMMLYATTTESADQTDFPFTASYRNLRVTTPTPAAPVVRFTGEISSWPPRWDLSDSDVWVPIQAAGISRRLGQGQKPLLSPLRRGIPNYRPLAYWPMEDGSEATQAAEVTGSVGPLTTTGLTYAEVDTLLSSEPLPKVHPGARIRSGHIPSLSTGAWEIDLAYRWEWDGADVANIHEEVLALYSSTLYVRATAAQNTAGRPYLTLTVYDLDGAELGDSFLWMTGNPAANVAWLGQWNRWRLRGWTDGGQQSIRLDAIDASNSVWGLSVYPGTPVGDLGRIDTRVGEVGDLAIGHITAWGNYRSVAYDLPFRGYAGETTTNRLARLSAGSGVPILVSGGDADTPLGTEDRGTLLDGVGAATDADLGTPGEEREGLGLSYRARSSLYEQDPVITLDYASGHISDPVEPVDDDQNIRNDIEVKRAHGSSYQVLDEDGPLGVDTVGRYDESVTLSLASDGQLPDQAGWRLHLGTVDELRWPTIRVNLANPRMREHIETILTLDAGDRIRILNPPHWTQATDLDLIVQGYEERIGAYVWDLTLTCTPASAWTVGEVAEQDPAVVDPSAPDRADTAGSELAFDVGAEETNIPVATTVGPPWTTDPDDMPFDITVGGEVMRVTEIIGDGTILAQAMICERSINGIVKAHLAGADVRLAQPMIVAL